MDGRALWANLHLLFWLSLVPFATAWLGGNLFAVGPTVLYGVLLLLDAIAYTILQQQLVRVNGADTPFARAVAVGVKEQASIVLYLGAIVAAFFSPTLAQIILALRRGAVVRAGPALRAADQGGRREIEHVRGALTALIRRGLMLDDSPCGIATFSCTRDFPGVEIAFDDDLACGADRIVVSGGTVDHLDFVCAWLRAQGFAARRIDAHLGGLRTGAV